MFLPEMKILIKYAMEMDISNIETKKGYLGASILRFESKNKDTISKLEKFTHKLGFETKKFHLKKDNLYELFCIFGKDTIDNSIYHLK
jgi:hypothetical protein